MGVSDYLPIAVAGCAAAGVAYIALSQAYAADDASGSSSSKPAASRQADMSKKAAINGDDTLRDQDASISGSSNSSSSSSSRACDHCKKAPGQQEHLLKCSRCHNAWYCSKVRPDAARDGAVEGHLPGELQCRRSGKCTVTWSVFWIVCCALSWYVLTHSAFPAVVHSKARACGVMHSSADPFPYADMAMYVRPMITSSIPSGVPESCMAQAQTQLQQQHKPHSTPSPCSQQRHQQQQHCSSCWQQQQQQQQQQCGWPHQHARRPEAGAAAAVQHVW